MDLLEPSANNIKEQVQFMRKDILLRTLINMRLKHLIKSLS